MCARFSVYYAIYSSAKSLTNIRNSCEWNVKEVFIHDWVLLWQKQDRKRSLYTTLNSGSPSAEHWNEIFFFCGITALSASDTIKNSYNKTDLIHPKIIFMKMFRIRSTTTMLCCTVKKKWEKKCLSHQFVNFFFFFFWCFYSETILCTYTTNAFHYAIN